MILCLVCFEKGPLDCSEIAREKGPLDCSEIAREKGPLDCSEIAREKKKEESKSKSQKPKLRTFLNKIFTEIARKKKAKAKNFLK